MSLFFFWNKDRRGMCVYVISPQQIYQSGAALFFFYFSIKFTFLFAGSEMNTR